MEATATDYTDELDTDDEDLTTEEAESRVNGKLDAARGALSSIREDFDEQYDETRAARRTFLDLPAIRVEGGDGTRTLQLVAEYGALPYETLRKTGRQASKVKKLSEEQREVVAQETDLVKACVALHMRFDGELLSLQDVLEAEHPVRYGSKLAEILPAKLGPISSARDAVRRAFQNNSVWLAVHYGDLMEWMADSESEGDEDILGE